jgi:hypothetical protein
MTGSFVYLEPPSESDASRELFFHSHCLLVSSDVRRLSVKLSKTDDTLEYDGTSMFLACAI